MKDVTNANFGLLIAYLLPGFVTLWGISSYSATVRSWLNGPSEGSPTVGGFLYVTLAAVAAGLFVSTIRWVVVDTLHHRTGISEAQWDFTALNKSLPAFELVIANHYRYYQFAANMLVATGFAFISSAWAHPPHGGRAVVYVGLFVFVESVLWIGSRDSLQKYYARAEAVMGRHGTTGETDLQPRVTKLPRTRLPIEGPLR